MSENQTSNTQTTKGEYDSPWKEGLSYYLPQGLQLFFPHIYEDIDWSKNYEFLNKELEKIIREAELGKRLADCLVKVYRKNGAEAWVLLHIELQGDRETNFSERMYVYNNRIYDTYRKQVASVAILADQNQSWRPQQFDYNLWGCEVLLRFPTVKLLDYDVEQLRESTNPFAIIVEAHLKTKQTGSKPQLRYREKLRIIKSLYQRGYDRQDILELSRLVDWIMVLPDKLQQDFTQAHYAYEEEIKMPYVTSYERFAIEKGLQQGSLEKARENVKEVLQIRFAELSETLIEAIDAIEEEELLSILHRESVTTPSLEEFQEFLEQALPKQPEETSEGETPTGH